MRNFSLILLLLLTSCKLFENKDTTAPIVSISIEGGNEISRGVTLYLEIEDDSKIDFVDIMIDDTTAVTVTTNFDTIRFDVTPFADESDHQLYAKVSDSEGNIGESEKLDVVITEFPGWRIYAVLDIEKWIYDFEIDRNDRIWFTNNETINIYDINSNSLDELNINDPNCQIENGEYIEEIEVVQGSRVWILHNLKLSEYDYSINRWIKTVELPPDSMDRNYNRLHAETFVIDSNYDLWIGTVNSSSTKKLIFYDHHEFSFFEEAEVYQIRKMLFHPNGTLYLAGDPGVDYFRNNIIFSFSDFPYSIGWDLSNVIIDSSGNVWTTGEHTTGGALKYNGDKWESIRPPNLNLKIKLQPLLTSQDGIIYFASYHIDGFNYISNGIVTYKEGTFFFWNNFDSPFNSNLQEENIIYACAEASNGDIWMKLDDALWRYRPSLGGYP